MKIFTATRKDGIEKMEQQINDWLGKQYAAEIESTQTALCQVADSPAAERVPCMAVTILYRTV